MTPAYDGSHLPADPAAPLPSLQPGQDFALPLVQDGVGVTLEAGETLYHQGDAARHSYLVTSGLLALSLDGAGSRGRLLDLAGPGDVVGALSPSQERYLDTASALGPDVRIVALPFDAQGSGTYDGVLGHAAAARLERLTEQLQDVDVPVAVRVAKVFLRLARRFGQEVQGGMVRLTLPLTHDTLAGLVGAARETTSSAVQQLRDLGLIAGTRGRYVVLPHAVQRFAEDSAVN
ncbi:MAG TPA: Crp/Fnr family transcriptional regulator [Trueperaceae bacterium]